MISMSPGLQKEGRIGTLKNISTKLLPKQSKTHFLSHIHMDVRNLIAIMFISN